MPTYEYLCQQCARPFEVLQSMAQHAESRAPACPQCGSSKVTRRFAALNVAVASRTEGGSAPGCGCSGGSCGCG